MFSQIRSISGPFFPVFGPNIGKYGPEITPYLDTFHAVLDLRKRSSKVRENFVSKSQLNMIQ